MIQRLMRREKMTMSCEWGIMRTGDMDTFAFSYQLKVYMNKTSEDELALSENSTFKIVHSELSLTQIHCT